MKRHLIIEGDALDMLRMHRQSSMAKGSKQSQGGFQPAAENEPADEPIDRPFTGEDDWFAQGDMHFMGDGPDEPLDAPAEPDFGGEDEPLDTGDEDADFMANLARKPADAPPDIELNRELHPDDMFGPNDEPGSDEMGEAPDSGGMSDDDALMGTSDFDDWARGHNAKLPNEVKPQQPPEPDAAGGYTEEPVEMPWSGHAVHGNADFGPDHDTEESSIIDQGEEKDEFRGGHVEGYPEEEEEGFGETPEE